MEKIGIDASVYVPDDVEKCDFCDKLCDKIPSITLSIYGRHYVFCSVKCMRAFCHKVRNYLLDQLISWG